MRTLVLLIAVLSAALHTVKGDTCYFNIQEHLQTGREALVLEYNNGKPTGIAYPNMVSNGQGLVAVTPQRELMLACPGKKNKLMYFSGQTAVVKCKPGKKLVIESGGVEKDIIKTDKVPLATSCSSRSLSTVERTGKPCGNVGEVLDAFYEVPGSQGIYRIPHFNMCYNAAKRITLYSSHIITGSSLEGKVVPEKSSPSFVNGVSQWGSPNVDKLYSPNNQKKMIHEILGQKAADTTYIDDKPKTLVKGHLTPNADFIYVPQRFSTYYYENAAPQWRKFNAEGGNWIKVENTVRELAIKLKADLEVWTGTFGVMELPNTTNVLKEIYLYIEKDVKKLPVPKVFWKLVRDPRQGTCIVIVGNNNLYLSQDTVCKPIDPTPRGWPILTELTKGSTYYCDYKNFLTTVTTAPSGVVCNGLLLI